MQPDNQSIIQDLQAHLGLAPHGEGWTGNCTCGRSEGVGQFHIVEINGRLVGSCHACKGANQDWSATLRASKSRLGMPADNRPAGAFTGTDTECAEFDAAVERADAGVTESKIDPASGEWYEQGAERDARTPLLSKLGDAIGRDIQRIADRREAKDTPQRYYEKAVIGPLHSIVHPFKWPAKPPSIEWVIDGWIPRGRITLLTGQGGYGKSRLAIQLAAAVAHQDRRAGSVWLEANRHPDDGYPSIRASDRGGHGDVLIVTWEDDKSEIANRLYRGHPNIANETEAQAAFEERVKIVDLCGKGPLWGPELGQNTGSRCAATPEGLVLANYVREMMPALVIIDPLAAAFAGAENDRSGVREFMSWIADFARPRGATEASDYGSAILMIAHPPKDTALAYSGSTDWHASSRAVITLKQGENGEGLYLDLIKHNHAPPQDKIVLAPGDDRMWWHRETDITRILRVTEKEKKSKPEAAPDKFNPASIE